VLPTSLQEGAQQVYVELMNEKGTVLRKKRSLHTGQVWLIRIGIMFRKDGSQIGN
jgi:hypothetical protein